MLCTTWAQKGMPHTVVTKFEKAGAPPAIVMHPVGANTPRDFAGNIKD